MSEAPPPYPGSGKGDFPPNAPYPQQPGGAAYPQQPGGAPQGYAPYPQQPPMPANYGTPPSYSGGYSQQGHTTVVLQQPMYPVIQHFRESPVRVKCQFCQADIVTSTYFETGTMAWVACFVLFMVGCTLGCCLIPFCMDGAKDVIHQCPNCSQQVGRYNRM